MSAWSAFWRMLRTAPAGYTLATLCLLVASGLTEGAGLFLLTPMLALLYQHGTTRDIVGQHANHALRWVQHMVVGHGLGALLASFVLLIAVRCVLQYGRDCLGPILQAQVVDGLRERCVKALVYADWRWLARRKHADDASLLLTDIGRLGVGMQAALGLVGGAVTGVACLLVAFALSWRLTGLALLSCCIVFGLLGRQRTSALSLGREWGQANRSLHGHILEALAGARIAKLLGAENTQLTRTVQAISEVRRRQLQFVARSSAAKAAYQLAAAVLLSVYVYIGIVVWRSPLPVLLTLVLILGRMAPLFSSAHQQIHQWLHATPAWYEINALISDAQAHAETTDASADTVPFPSSVRHAIRLDDVSITHTGRGTAVLDHVSLVLPAGSTIAVTGASGVGKSTLADLLSGLVAPDEGAMWVDDVEVTPSARRAWRKRVAYVTQSAWFFHGSIRENLLWAAPEASDQALQDALEKAAADFVFALPEGLDTVIGDGGGGFSGGERQRLALARALLRRPALLVLDEATSALDEQNEARIQEAIATLKGSAIILLIGHRPSAIASADLLIRLQQGRTPVMEIRPDLASANPIASWK